MVLSCPLKCCSAPLKRSLVMLLLIFFFYAPIYIGLDDIAAGACGRASAAAEQFLLLLFFLRSMTLFMLDGSLIFMFTQCYPHCCSTATRTTLYYCHDQNIAKFSLQLIGAVPWQYGSDLGYSDSPPLQCGYKLHCTQPLLLYVLRRTKYYKLHIYNSQIHRATSLEQILGGSIGPTQATTPILFVTVG